MKKTLYVLFVFLLMFLGNIEVLANTTHNTQESDGGGETIDNPNEEGNVCRYYFGNQEIHIIYNDQGFYKAEYWLKGKLYTDTKTNSEKGPKQMIFDFTYDEWMNEVNKSESKSDCPYSIYMGVDQYAPSLFSGDVYFTYRVQLKEYSSWPWFFSKGFGWDQTLCPCISCLDTDFDPVTGSSEFNCENLIGSDMVSLINQFMFIIKILVPILVIGLGITDFVKAVFASNEDDMKKAQKTFVKRLIIAVIIFFSPLVVNALIDITNEAAGFANSGTCGIG